MKCTTTTLMSTAVAALLFVACTPEPGTETERVNDQMQENNKEMSKADDPEEYMDERREATRELTDLREKLDARLIREEKRLADGIKDNEKRAECEGHIQELKANITRIDASMAMVDSSPNTDWQKVKADSRKMVDDTENWFERQAEKIDVKTDADADHDGH